MIEYCFGIKHIKFNLYSVKIKKNSIKTVQIGRGMNSVIIQVISRKK